MSAAIYIEGDDAPDIYVGRSVASSLLEDFCEYARENLDLTGEEESAVDELEWHPHGDEPHRMKPAVSALLYNLAMRTGKDGGNVSDYIHGLYAADPFDPTVFSVDSALVLDGRPPLMGHFATPYNVEGTATMGLADFEAQSNLLSGNARCAQDALVYFLEGRHLPERFHHPVVRDFSEPEYGLEDGAFDNLVRLLGYSAVNKVDLCFE